MFIGKAESCHHTKVVCTLTACAATPGYNSGANAAAASGGGDGSPWFLDGACECGVTCGGCNGQLSGGASEAPRFLGDAADDDDGAQK